MTVLRDRQELGDRVERRDTVAGLDEGYACVSYWLVQRRSMG